jgi:DNA-binding transcriptional MerR regulator
MAPRDLTIGEAARATGLTIDTLRYYEKEGLTPAIGRQGGRRRYGPAELEWIAFVARMRASGLPVAQLRTLTQLARQGDATLPERRAIVLAHRTAIERRIAQLHDALALVDRKLAHYDEKAARSGRTRQGAGPKRPARAALAQP